jgi:hypothetical protein
MTKFFFWVNEYAGAFCQSIRLYRMAALFYRAGTYYGLKSKILMVNPKFVHDKTGTEPMLIRTPK